MIKKLLAQRKNSHWYNRDGIAIDEVPRKDGKGMKKCTVVEARALGLLPSVTTILKVLSKPQLDIWIRGQSIKAAIAQGRRPKGMRMKQFINNIIDRADAYSNKAMEFGLQTHTFVEDYCKGLVQPQTEKQQMIADALKPFKSFVLEQSYANDTVAGRIDLTAVNALNQAVLLDTKTQRTTKGKKFNLYDDYILQMAAYDTLKPCQKYYILFVSSNEDRVELQEISSKDIDEAKKVFEGLTKVFYWRNGL